MNKINYEIFHEKNKNVQYKIIDDRNYTYQSLIYAIKRYFTCKRVIDIGCGVGTIDFYLSRKNSYVLGLDVSLKAIQLARRSVKEMKLSNVNFFVSDVMSSNIKKYGKFENFILSEVIEHLEDDVAFLECMCNLLCDGAVGVISTPSVNSPLYRWGFLDNFDRKVGHLRRYSKHDLETLLSKYFDIVECWETEGLLRNFLYTHDKFGFLIRFIRFPITVFINIIDNLLGRLFGFSNIYCVVRFNRN